MNRSKRGDTRTNSRGLNAQAFSLFLALILIAFIAAYLLQSDNIGLVTRGSVNTSVGAPTPRASSFSLNFHSNLPAYTQPQNLALDDTNPVSAKLQLYVTGLPNNVSITRATTSMNGIPVSDHFTWDASTFVLTFPDTLVLDPLLPEGDRTYGFTIDTSDGSRFQFSQHVRVDHTKPEITTMILSPDRKTLTFHMRDPPASNGNPGSGLGNWNSSDVADALNVELIRTGTGTNPYSLENGLPNALECVPVHPNDESEFNCAYPFTKPLASSVMPIVFLSDDAGNRIAHPLQGNYEADYEESIRANQWNLPAVSGFSSPAMQSVLSLQSAPSTIVFDVYITHFEPGVPSFEHRIAGWTLEDKIINSVNAVTDAAQYWKQNIELLYPGKSPQVSIGKVVAIVPQGTPIPASVQYLVTQVIEVSDSEYPSILTSNCDFDAGGVNFDNYCIQHITPCDFIGCTSQTQAWASRRIPVFELDHLVNPKEPTHLPIVVTDFVSGSATGGLGGFTELMHGNLYMSYAPFISPISHHFRPNKFRDVLSHEMGHGLGLGHTDFSTNLMYGVAEVTQNQLDPMQIARVQAGLARSNFSPPALGQWYNTPPQNIPYFTDCGPETNNPGVPSGRLLDWFSTHKEEVEAPYSGKPLNSGEVLAQTLEKRYCPLVYDGQNNVIQPAPEAVDSTNVSMILAQYPGAVVKQAKTPDCTCIRDSSIPGNGTGPGPSGPGPGSMPTGGGGGGGAKTREPKGGKGSDCGTEIPGYKVNHLAGGTLSVQVSCPNVACPVPEGAAPGTVVSCQETEGEDACGDRAFVEIELGGTSTHYCCKCRPAEVSTPTPLSSEGGDIFPNQ